MAYRIMLAGTSTDPVFAIDPATANYYEYETGGEAQERAKALAASGDGQKWRVKRVLDTRWRSREAHKFETGVYQHVSWARCDWWQAADHIHHLHYPHPSRTEPGMIAYTESADKGMDNKQTQIKPGRYLEKYFADHLRYYGFSIKKLAMEFERDHKPRPVHFADTEDKIQWVYETGPDSCMSSPGHRERHGYGYPVPGRWPNDTHACCVYAAGDLAVAYITNDDTPDGKVEARALVWPAKKTHSRCYGKNELVMKANLQMLGYAPNAPYGAKVQRVPVADTGLFLIPYIDVGHATGQGSMAVKDCKTHFELVTYEPGSYPANNTSGLSGMRLDRNLRPMMSNVQNCQVCGEHLDECGDLVPVYRNNSGGDYEMWCSNCIQDDGTDEEEDFPYGAFECHYDGRFYARRHVRAHTMWDGQIWSDRAFRAHGFKCAATGKNYTANLRVRMYDGTSWCYDYFCENGFTCHWSGDHYPNNMAVKMVSGRVFSQPAFAAHGFTCESCDKNEGRDRVMFGSYCAVCRQHEQNSEYRLRNYKVTPTTEEYIPNVY